LLIARAVAEETVKKTKVVCLKKLLHFYRLFREKAPR
jgi:hypothetical protein